MIVTRFRALCAVVLLAAAAPAAAQNYPAKPIRLVNGFAPGGSTDIVVRTLAQRLGEILGQPVVVDARPGAGTNVATEIVAKSVPDGYTLLHTTSSLAINRSLYRKLSYDALKDFVPVVLLTQSYNALAVHPSVPARTVKELIEYAKANPGKLNYGSSGNGATNHLGMELFKSMAHVQISHVPYKGGGQALTDIIGGQVQVLLNPPVSLIPHHQTGKLRVLGIGSPKRVPGIDLPTVAESGELPGFETGVWFGVFAPAGTPAPIVTRLNRESNRILAEKEVRDTFQSHGLTPIGGSPEEFGAYLRTEIDRWAKVVKESGARVD